MNKPKILLLFGAGASTGSGGTNKPVPLGRDLFDCLCKEYPNTWGSKITGDLKAKFSANFEDGMDSLYYTSDSLRFEVAPLLKDMSVYFSKFSIASVDNLYFQLVSKFKTAFENRDIVISTLNYECLVEQAIFGCGMNVDWTGKGAGTIVLKPHGSCNFIPQNFEIGGSGLSLDIGTAIIITAPMIVSPDKVEEVLQNTLFSMMSLYTKEKRNIISPGFIGNITKEYTAISKSADIIICIGVNPLPEVDVHIWNPIAESIGKVFFVGGKGCDEWCLTHAGRAECIGNRFENKDTFNKICELITDGLTV